ncbi:hypothetical protein C8035_v011872 [Colletotrichum spinosum]|uniref:Uncharacterized protein n=1 Tax=Colletotrichum spinosum TaxID=1347390 RepID=A0A4V6QEF7_9PEZI|nr:hypothetical protein C8035_v011872 [Colletotrichum spinosum]
MEVDESYASDDSGNTDTTNEASVLADSSSATDDSRSILSADANNENDCSLGHCTDPSGCGCNVVFGPRREAEEPMAPTDSAERKQQPSKRESTRQDDEYRKMGQSFTIMVQYTIINFLGRARSILYRGYDQQDSGDNNTTWRHFKRESLDALQVQHDKFAQCGLMTGDVEDAADDDMIALYAEYNVVIIGAQMYIPYEFDG